MGETLINDKYRPLKKLGNGAFGSVFLAEQEVFGIALRTVALKMFETEIKDRFHAREIFNDAVMLIKLLDSCPDMYIRSLFVQVFDMGSFESFEEDGKASTKGYLAMELMEKDLRTIIGSTGSSDFRKTSVTEVLSYMNPVIDALAYMHSQNPPVLHRDLKPDNVLFRYNNGVQIKVADFGLAIQSYKFMAPAIAAGTLNYQDLESFRLRTASPQSDVYAIGVMFYELLTGKYPFEFDYSVMTQQDETARKIYTDRLEQVVTGKVVPPSAFNPELRHHPWLEKIILKCLAPFRKDRMTDALELKHLIRNHNAIPSGQTINEKYAGLTDQAKHLISSGPSQFTAAEQMLTKACRMMPRKCSAPVLLARLNIDRERFPQAEAILVDRVEKGLECPHLYMVLAYLWEKKKNDIMKRRYQKRAETIGACRFL